MTTLAHQYAFRREMVRRLEADLLGPADGADEILDEEPLDRYIVGVLWPSANEVQIETAEDPVPAETDIETPDDTPVSQSRMRYPSSLGITFSVDSGIVSTVSLRCGAARYEAQETGPEDSGDQRSRSRRVHSTRTWKRVEVDPNPIRIDLLTSGPNRTTVADGLQLYTLVRRPVSGVVTVTAALVNTHLMPPAGGRDAVSWFQPLIEATAEEPAFVDRNQIRHVGHDEDMDSGSLLYRNNRTFAAGHGCAAEWNPPITGDTRTNQVRSTFVPRSELLRAKPNRLTGVDLRMSHLSTASDAEVLAALTALVKEYRGWIEERRDEAFGDSSDVPEALRSVADRHLKAATRAADRIAAGIDLLHSTQLAMKAFRLMNEAMQAQRARQEWIRSGARGAPGAGEEDEWRPFQIAFVLLNLPGLSDRDHDDRKIADLLWFPTGGGKTEAYLGLIAYTVLHRRLVQPEASGVAAIMRYTLRLLTIQQFERASMLMCALERVRIAHSGDLGGRGFSIGLWVGRGATPNTLDEASTALRKLGRGQDVDEGNPIQIVRCPWCGTTLDVDQYRVVTQPHRHLRIACGRPDCDFGSGLPVHVVDEDVYAARPELVIGTVDKFARMAWAGDVRALFGRDGTGDRPDLIVQDELHLISGPLGSMVGLYETAVDAACAVDPADVFLSPSARPKVVASTATIRRAESQVRAVFDRQAAQFPPPGLDPDRSFFAEPASADELGARKYVGLMAPGTSQQTLMVRTYASLLQSAKDVPGADVVRDPYWTLIGYFNSLRVLGSAYLQVQDDVKTRLDVLAGRFDTTAREMNGPSELTSRVASRDIPERLNNLEARYPLPTAEDVVLATNMISVGLDVDRLGLMTVMGQPQSSAEYIQATSRVGRRYPGLVITILNSARSRDRSHYENFVPFHESIYRAVEATSATPFAARARDRGLHGVLVGLARLLFGDLAGNDGAGLVDGQEEKLRRAAELIVARAQEVSEESDETDQQLNDLINVWIDSAAARTGLRYRNKSNPQAALLIDPADALVDPDIDYDQNDTPWPTLQSLRDVDAESTLHQIPIRRSSK